MSIFEKLNLREKRRLKVHGVVPVDILNSSCTTKELIENNTTHLYRYGCYFQDTNVELEDFTKRAEKSSSCFRLRGFLHHFHFMVQIFSTYQYDFLVFDLHTFIPSFFMLLNLSRTLLEKFMAYHFIIIIVVVASFIL